MENIRSITPPPSDVVRRTLRTRSVRRFEQLGVVFKCITGCDYAKLRCICI
jgi:hypothetical protein